MIDLAIKAFEILRQKNNESGKRESTCHLEGDLLINASFIGRKTPILGEDVFKLDGRWIDIYHNYSNSGLKERVLLHDECGTRSPIAGPWIDKVQEIGHKAILKGLLGS